MPQTSREIFEGYVAEVRGNLAAGHGEPEAQLTAPVSNLIKALGRNSLSLSLKKK